MDVLLSEENKQHKDDLRKKYFERCRHIEEIDQFSKIGAHETVIQRLWRIF